jgi:hypothetical protein
MVIGAPARRLTNIADANFAIRFAICTSDYTTQHYVSQTSAAASSGNGSMLVWHDQGQRYQARPGESQGWQASADEKRWGMSTAAMEKKIQALHRSGMGMLRIGRELGVGNGFVQRVISPSP